ncbi:MAG: hypothetical protein GC190_21735 [Alphaproteobacteria bacterium]|nr:hypothetical protein [Alphaproteobacteria bacterium]
MTDKPTADEYRRMAEQARAVANSTRDAKEAAEALKIAEDYERMADATDASLQSALDQIRKPN